MIDYREIAYRLMEDGEVSAEQLLEAALKTMTPEQVKTMLDANEISPRLLADAEDLGINDDVYDGNQSTADRLDDEWNSI